jgi:Flp pilus assembly protein TadD
VRALLRAVMYVVALAAGADTFLIAVKYLTVRQHQPSGQAAVVAGVIAVVVALILATVPIAIYQRVMRRVIARRRLAAGMVPLPRAPLPSGPALPSGPPFPSVADLPSPGVQMDEPEPDRGLSATELLALGRSADDTSANGRELNQLEVFEQPGLAAQREVEACERRLAAAERVFGAEHPQTYAGRRDLASAYWGAGQLGRAIETYEETLDDCQRALGPTHPETLVCRSDLAAAYEMDGRLDEAINLYAHTLAIRERVLGAEHPDTISSRSNLAVAYAVRDNLARGRRSLTQQAESDT